MKGLIIRAKAKWIEDGEKPSKYFTNLEKRHYVNKTITKLKNRSNVEVTDQKDLLQEMKSFYSDLYKDKDDSLDVVDLDILLNNTDAPKLNEEMREELERNISIDEALQSLKK